MIEIGRLKVDEVSKTGEDIYIKINESEGG